MTLRLAVAALLAVALAPPLLLTPLAARAAELSADNVDVAEQGFFSQHFHYRRPEPELEERVVKGFVQRLDPQKIYFLASDVEGIRRSFAGLFAMNGPREWDAVRAARDVLVTRTGERRDAVKRILGDSFKFDTSTVFVMDPDERPHPATTAEADAAIEKYVQFQIANYLLSDVALPEAKEHMVKNYERALKRVTEFKESDLLAIYLDAFASALDPHTSFLARSTLEDFEINMRLSLEGIGASLTSKDGFTIIEQLLPGGAAEASGRLKPKDKIVAVAQGDGEPLNVIDMDLSDVVRKIRGPAGSEVRLTILRQEGGKTERFVLPLIRRKINLEDRAASIAYFERFAGGKTVTVGLLTLPSFYGEVAEGDRYCSRDMKRLLEEARAIGAVALVLDLSNNGGGSLSEAVKVAGLFFAEGAVVKQSTRQLFRSEILLRDTDPKVDWAGPLVVLTSRVSASASEIVAGTLQDYRRAVIVGGDHTFGKGSVQTVIPLDDKMGALKVTIGMYYIPGGNSTQQQGVNSDIPMPSPFSTDEIGEKTLDYCLPPTKVAPFLSPEAQGDATGARWNPVTGALVKGLAERSAARVAADPEFRKIAEDMEKARRKGKEIKLAEIVEAKNEAKRSGKDEDRFLSLDEQKAEYLKRPDVAEAVSIAADLWALESGAALPPLPAASAGTSETKVK